MKFERWSIPPIDGLAADCLTDAGHPYLLSLVLASRGVATAEAATLQLERESELTLSPFLMKDMDKAVERIQRALSKKETIAVYGDYDVDGITSTCLLTDYLRRSGANCLRYIPRRVEDGYGLGCDALQLLYNQGVRLLITVDCGITGVAEIDFANSLGMDVVVTDHHECKEQLPRAVAVVDPHQGDCPYPFKHLAGVGVALKLVLALGGRGQEDALFARYAPLAAIGTVADVMRMEGENKTIVCRGLEALPRTDFVGIHALLEEAGLAGKVISSIQIGFVLAPRINAAGRMGKADLAADLLETRDSARAEELAKALCALNRERQAVEQDICAQAITQMERLGDDQRNALVLASEGWHQGVVGIVASRLSEKYACPSFMIHLQDGMGKGSCRSYGGFNLFAALERCSDLLEGFGGHELAAGFTIREENIPRFRTRMNRYVRELQGAALPVSSLEVDAVIARPALLTLDEVARLTELEPYGTGNVRPVFALLGAYVDSVQSVGQGKHLKLRISKASYGFDGIFFSATAEEFGLKSEQRVDVAFHLQINEFRNNSSIQMQLLDIRPSLLCSKNEEEALRLLARLEEGAPLTAQEKSRLQTSRDVLGRLWRELVARVPAEGITVDNLPFLRTLADAVGSKRTGNENFLRAALALRIFAERELLTSVYQQEKLTLRLTAEGKKVSLVDCPLLKRLEYAPPSEQLEVSV